MRKHTSQVFVLLVAIVLAGIMMAGPSFVSPVSAGGGIPIIDLAPNGPGGTALGINALGQVVGESDGTMQATLWEEEAGQWVAYDVDPLETTISFAYSINDLGQVVGSSSVSGVMHATLWEETADGAWVAQDLDPLETTMSFAFGINALGQVVGMSSGNGVTLWEVGEDGAWVAQSLPGMGTGATGINDNGQVVGVSYMGAQSATLWEKKGGVWVPQYLGSPGMISFAYGINDNGQVVGSSNVSGVMQATLWEVGADGAWVPQLLGTLGKYDNSEARSINAHGQVVGVSCTGNPASPTARRATLWEKTDSGWEAQDLGALGGSADDMSNAFGINDLGQVAGSSQTASGETHPTLWIVPVPPVVPEEIAAAAEQVRALLSAGVLDQDEADALTAKLDAAQRQIEKGNAKPAANVLTAFIKRLGAMVDDGRLTTEQAQPLIDAANAAIVAISTAP